MFKNIKINTKKIIYLSMLPLGISIATISYAEEIPPYNKENIRAFSLCKEETRHTTLYDFGKILAEGNSYYSKTEEGKAYTPKTRSSFFNRGLRGYTKKYGIPENNIIHYCYTGYLSTARDASWSSVHQGFIDYLSNTSKAKFLSLPER